MSLKFIAWCPVLIILAISVTQFLTYNWMSVSVVEFVVSGFSGFDETM